MANSSSEVNEKHIQSLAKMMAVTPDATTDLPLAFLKLGTGKS
jgi:hypothetical protein